MKRPRTPRATIGKEGEHNLTGAHVREQECLIGDRTIKLPISKVDGSDT